MTQRQIIILRIPASNPIIKRKQLFCISFTCMIHLDLDLKGFSNGRIVTFIELIMCFYNPVFLHFY